MAGYRGYELLNPQLATYNRALGHGGAAFAFSQGNESRQGAEPMPRKRASSGTRSRAAREARAKREARYKPTTIPADLDLTSPAHTLSARDLYVREKARRANRANEDPDHPLSQARRQYEALLASEAEAGRGGRPRKVVAAKNAARKALLESEEASED